MAERTGLIVSLAASALYSALLLARTGLAHREASRQADARGRPEATALDGVAVLQPILSGDPALGEVLARALDALPDVAFVWLVDEDDPEALRLSSALVADRPGRRIERIVLPPAPAGVNPKTFKLERGRGAVDADVIVVLDDDATLEAGALAALAGALDAGALATALPWYEDAPTLAGALLARFVDDHAALTYLAPLALLGPVSINGMCYAMRTGTLESIGGFAPLERHLTDDLALAQAFRERGLAIVQTTAPVRMRTSLEDVAAYVRLMHRWYLFATLLLAGESVRVRVLAVVLQGLPPLLLWVAIVAPLVAPSAGAVAALIGALLVRATALASLHRRFTQEAPRARPVVSIVAELLQPLHLAHALAVRTVRWRRRRYRVRAADDFEPA